MTDISNPKTNLHSGVQHWTAQRISSVLLIPLTLWLLWTISALTGVDYDAAKRFFTQPLHAFMAALMAAVVFYHAQLGIREICEDYLYPPWFRSALIWIARIGCLVGFLATIYAIYILALGT